MNNSSRPVSRAQNIVNRVFPFFGELARQHRSDIRALSICQQLIALNGSILHAPVIASLLANWQSELPAERALQESELHWALCKLEAYLLKQLDNRHTCFTASIGKKPDRPKLRLIQGGMPAMRITRVSHRASS